MRFRLCLVAVKRFPENTYFPEMLISRKGKCFHVFGCISKNFSENIFWCLEKKKENTNQKTQSHNPGKKIINNHNTRSRSRHGRRTGNIFVVDDFFFLGCGLCFLICVFLLLFQTPENIFRKIF